MACNTVQLTALRWTFHGDELIAALQHRNTDSTLVLTDRLLPQAEEEARLKAEEDARLAKVVAKKAAAAAKAKLKK